MLWTLLLFACALSLDAFSAGFAYGLREIKIPISSQLGFLATSTATVGIGILAGRFLSWYIPADWAGKSGGLILFVIGIWWLLRGKQVASEQREGSAKTLLRLQLASLAVIIQVLEEPVSADLDASGVISVREAAVLGVALSMDALGASFAASLAGASGTMMILLIGLFQQLFLLVGICLGGWTSCMSWLRRNSNIISGLMLCLLSLLRFLGKG